LNIKDACLLLNASYSTITKMIKDGILPTIRIGAKHLILKSDIEKQFKISIQNEAVHI
jgi:excisionase family DNA binding protein